MAITLGAGVGCTREYTPHPPPATTNTIAAAAAHAPPFRASIPPPHRDPAANAAPASAGSRARRLDAIFKALRGGQAGNQPQRLFGFSLHRSQWIGVLRVGVFIANSSND